MTLRPTKFHLAPMPLAARSGLEIQASLLPGAFPFRWNAREAGRTFHPREAWRAHARRETPVSLEMDAMPTKEARRDGALIP